MKAFPLKDPIAHITWKGDRLLILDQRLLPRRIHYLTCRNAGAVAHAIRCMALRGAPLIGVARIERLLYPFQHFVIEP